jgi:hypothetical protein
MSANESFEAFAERFYKKYGFLPLGKDDPCRPSAETILARLGETFGELERAESAVRAANRPSTPCSACGRDMECPNGCQATHRSGIVLM